MGAIGVMAKKRVPSLPPESGAAGPERRPTAFTVKGTVAWKEWLDRAARHCRLSTSSLVDLAVTKYAKEAGFEEPPPER